MDARRAKLLRFDLGPEGDQFCGKTIAGIAQAVVQPCQNFFGVQNGMGGVFGQCVRSGDKIVRVGQVLRKQVGMFARQGGGLAQMSDETVQPAGLASGRKNFFRAGRVALQLHGLFGQAEGQRLRPVNVGSPVEIIADPAGERGQGRAKLAPAIGESAFPDLQDDFSHAALGLRSIFNRGLHFLMFAIEADCLVPVAAVGLDQLGELCPAGFGRLADTGSEGGSQFGRQGEGRVAGKDKSAAFLAHSRGKGLEPLFRDVFQPGGQRRPGGSLVGAGMLGRKRSARSSISSR